MSVILKDATFRHRADGKRLVEATLYVDSLSSLPTSAGDIEGLLDDDVLDAGSTAVNMNSGAISMFNGTSWSAWG